MAESFVKIVVKEEILQLFLVHIAYEMKNFLQAERVEFINDE